MKPLYISDLDGTLLNAQGRLEQETIQTIHRLIEAGHWFTVATARSIASAGEIMEQLGLRIPAVLMNGVLIYDPVKKECVHYEAIEPHTVQKALEIFEQGGRLPYRYAFDGREFSVEYRRLYHEADRSFVAERTGLYRRRCEVEQYTGCGRTVYLNALDRYEVLAPIVEKLQRLEGVSVVLYDDAYHKDMWFCECFSGKTSKAVAARRVQSMLGASSLVAFGDNTNDIPIFQEADECYAVANAVDELRAMATGVIGSNLEQGVPRYLAERTAT